MQKDVESFLEKLEKWKSISQYMPLDEFIWQIYLDTGYYQYVGLLPNGAMRQANLKTLFEKAKFISPFEKASIILSNVFNFSPASPSYELVALSKSLFSFLG